MTDGGPVFSSAPPERIDLAGGALLRCRPERAVAAVTAINASLQHLRPWMAWAAEPATELGMATFFAASEELWDDQRDFGYSIVDALHEGLVLGGCGLHGRLGPAVLEIGYWIHVDHVGRGLATRAAAALTSAAFGIDGIELVRIQCEDANARSARVPQKLGYSFQGVSVADAGPCEGRPTQAWHMERAHWMTGCSEGAP